MAPLTRERLLAAGQELFAKHGIGQVGLDRVLAQAQLTKTTFYNHFSSKEELIREAVARDEERLVELLESGLAALGDGDPRSELLAAFDVVAGIYAEGSRAGALLFNALMEFPAENDPTRAAAVRCKQSLGRVLRSRVERLPDADPERLTNQLLLIFDGSLISYQVNRDPESFAEGRRVAALVLAG